jgi:hypothetical protein
MPYALQFVRQVPISDPDRYINDCCIGGDLVLERLLPALRNRYGDLRAIQEDWGWFVWFEHAGIKLAVDVFTDDAKSGEFRIHLTSSAARFLLGRKIKDVPVLDDLREVVERELRGWPVQKLLIEQVDAHYRPAQGAT